MNEIPTTLFCGRLPENWQPECQVRARSHKNGTIKKLNSAVEVNNTAKITLIILGSIVALAVIISAVTYFIY